MLRQQLWPLVLAVLVIAGIVWMSQSLRFVELVLNRGLPASTLFELAGLVLPMFTSVFLPIVLFGTVAFSYNRMIMDSEMVILRAAGLSPLRLSTPALALSGVVLLACYALNVYYMPAAYRHFKDLQFAIRSNFTQVLLREGAFNDLGNGVTVYVRERANNGELLGIFIYDRRQNGEPVTMMAERGALVQTELAPRVVLVNGNRQIVKRAGKDLSILYFDRYTLDLKSAEGDSGPRWREPRERFLHELFNPATTGPQAATNQRLRLKLLAEGHQRLVSPWLAPAFVLIALVALLTGEFNRRGQARRLLAASALMVLAQSASVSLASMAGSTAAAVPFMYLLPATIIGICLWLLMRQQGKPATTAELTARV
ncbi:MAG: export transporter permease LptF [Pseudomonadota bacterium]|jgi:lipopolysaccharide export system permease protein